MANAISYTFTSGSVTVKKKKKNKELIRPTSRNRPVLKEGEKFFTKNGQHKTKVESFFRRFYNYGIMIM